MQKDSFILYNSFYEPLKMLSEKQMGKLFKAIFEYQINGCISVDPDIQMAFAFIKNQIDIDGAKYQEKIRKNKENGQKGGRPPKKDIPDENQAVFNETQKSEGLFGKPKKGDNDNEYVNENDNEYDYGEKKHAPTKPFSKLSKDEFYNSLTEHVGEYSKQTVRDFFDYWTEPSASGKMKFQLEKTWSIPHRLATWKRNEGKFGVIQQTVKQTKKKPYGVWDV